MSQDNSNRNSHQINYKAIRRFVQQNLAKTKSESPISSSNHNYDDSPNDLSIASDTSVSYKNNATSLSPRNHYNEPVDNTSDNISTYSNADSLDASITQFILHEDSNLFDESSSEEEFSEIAENNSDSDTISTTSSIASSISSKSSHASSSTSRKSHSTTHSTLSEEGLPNNFLKLQGITIANFNVQGNFTIGMALQIMFNNNISILAIQEPTSAERTLTEGETTSIQKHCDKWEVIPQISQYQIILISKHIMAYHRLEETYMDGCVILNIFQIDHEEEMNLISTYGIPHSFHKSTSATDAQIKSGSTSLMPWTKY